MTYGGFLNFYYLWSDIRCLLTFSLIGDVTWPLIAFGMQCVLLEIKSAVRVQGKWTILQWMEIRTAAIRLFARISLRKGLALVSSLSEFFVQSYRSMTWTFPRPPLLHLLSKSTLSCYRTTLSRPTPTYKVNISSIVLFDILSNVAILSVIYCLS